MLVLLGFCAPFVVLFAVSLNRASKKKNKPWLWYIVGIVLGIVALCGARVQDLANYGAMTQEHTVQFIVVAVIALIFGLLINRATKKG